MFATDSSLCGRAAPLPDVAHHLDDVRLDQAFTELAGFECEFDVDTFHLYVHDESVGWQPAHDFGLGG